MSSYAVERNIPVLDSPSNVDRGSKRDAPCIEQKLGGVPIIAEDLGVITPDVHELREGIGAPGMVVLQFAFGSGATNTHLPHNHYENCVCYPGALPLLRGFCPDDVMIGPGVCQPYMKQDRRYPAPCLEFLDSDTDTRLALDTERDGGM